MSHLRVLCTALLWALSITGINSLAQLSALQQQQPPSTTTRRAWLLNAGITGVVTAAVVVADPAAAFAADIDVGDAKAAAKEAVRVESSKGIAYMREQLKAKDYDSLVEFTKTYDQILRKGAMGKAKKLMKESSNGDELTSITNAVTFDLIGINRSVRKGREDPEQAAKYIQELQDDVDRFLSMD